MTDQWSPDQVRAKAREMMRAVLAVLREPDEAMFMRGGNVAVSNRGKDDLNPRPGPRVGDMAARDVWKSMIDTILDDDTETV